MYAFLVIFGTVPWFPQDQASTFFIAKGVLALISTLLLLFHMSMSWSRIVAEGTLGQRMRYYTLLAFSILITGSSAEQYQEGELVSYRHLGAMVVTVLLIYSMVISIREEQRRYPH